MHQHLLYTGSQYGVGVGSRYLVPPGDRQAASSGNADVLGNSSKECYVAYTSARNKINMWQQHPSSE